MATLYITEVEKVAFTLVDGQPVAAPQLPGVAEQAVAIAAGSTPSAPFNARTRYVLINADAVCSLAWAANDGSVPTANVGAQRMGQNETRFIGVTPGGRLAVIANV